MSKKSKAAASMLTTLRVGDRVRLLKEVPTKEALSNVGHYHGMFVEQVMQCHLGTVMREPYRHWQGDATIIVDVAWDHGFRWYVRAEHLELTDGGVTP